MANKNLNAAKAAKNDEFYTRLVDIENECKYYKDHFRNKVIYCNCDDARESNFFKYFSLNFEFFGLKKLITTGYKENGHGVKLVYEGDKNGNKIVDDEEIQITELQGDGDFRSDECIEFLKEADIVVTNPPFSLFREYIAQLVEYGKEFLIIGKVNGIACQETFSLIKSNKLWLGVSSFNNGMYFNVPDDYEYTETYKFERERDGRKAMRVASICWFTNLTHSKRNRPLDLVKWYEKEPQSYPKYDNYDAIEVSKVCNIPSDYQGVMGVPITFLDKYYPEQFEIVGLVNSGNGIELGFVKDYSEYSEMRQDGTSTKCSGKKTNGNPMLVGKPTKGNYYINKEGIMVYSTYTRILIRHKHPISYDEYFNNLNQ